MNTLLNMVEGEKYLLLLSASLSEIFSLASLHIFLYLSVENPLKDIEWKGNLPFTKFIEGTLNILLI